MRHTFRPLCEPLDRRDLPATGWISTAWGLYTLYTSPPVAAVRKIAFGGKLGRLAWTGQARFAFGLVRVSHPFPLRKVVLRADVPRVVIGLATRRIRRNTAKARAAQLVEQAPRFRFEGSERHAGRLLVGRTDLDEAIEDRREEFE